MSRSSSTSSDIDPLTATRVSFSTSESTVSDSLSALSVIDPKDRSPLVFTAVHEGFDGKAAPQCYTCQPPSSHMAEDFPPL